MASWIDGVVAFCSAVFLCDPCFAASALVLENGSVLVVNEHKLDLWEQGNQVASWTADVGGFATGAQSFVAAIAKLSTGDILAVERSGGILRVNASGEVQSRALPIYEYLRLAIDFTELEGDLFDYPAEEIGRTGAAFFTPDGKFLYLAGDQFSNVRKIPTETFFAGGVVPVTDRLYIQFKDKNFNITKWIDEWKNSFPEWSFVGDASAMAVCNGTIIVGTKQGAVNFSREEVGLGDAGNRLRQVGDVNSEPRAILDAGCINEQLAYTISFDTGNGEIQLWNLDEMSAIDTVGFKDDAGHPGMAYSGTASRSGHYLATIGDGDVRLWSVASNKLELVATHWTKTEGTQLFSIAPVDQDDFVFSDGSAIWRISATSGSKSIYSGFDRHTNR